MVYSICIISTFLRIYYAFQSTQGLSTSRLRAYGLMSDGCFQTFHCHYYRALLLIFGHNPESTYSFASVIVATKITAVFVSL